MPRTRSEGGQGGLTREALTAAALELLGRGGPGVLSMRSLADRLDVKAASLYWHVRDRGELLALVADAVLREARPAPPSEDWRGAARGSCHALAAVLSAHGEVAQVILEVPDALRRSELLAGLAEQLRRPGLPETEAREAAAMLLVHVVAGAIRRPVTAQPVPGLLASVSIDSASRGVVVRAGRDLDGLARVPRQRTAGASAIVAGRNVVVRRRLGVGRADVELNPGNPWHVRVQAPTWNTLLDLSGLDVRGIHVDGGATRVECILPSPRGVVPIHVSGGAVGCAFHRPPGVAVVARISTGALRVKLDGFSLASAISDMTWETPGGSSADDRYEVAISGGAVQVELDERAAATADEAGTIDDDRPSPGDAARLDLAIDLLLDGVEARTRRGVS